MHKILVRIYTALCFLDVCERATQATLDNIKVLNNYTINGQQSLLCVFIKANFLV
jgi:hypothetical protein